MHGQNPADCARYGSGNGIQQAAVHHAGMMLSHEDTIIHQVPIFLHQTSRLGTFAPDRLTLMSGRPWSVFT